MESVRLPAGKLVNFLFLQTKTIREALGRKGAAHGENFLFFCRQERTGHFFQKSCTIVR